MNKLLGILRLDFIPSCSHGGLLVIRLALGTLMLVAHGWPKLATFAEKSTTFPDPLGVGSSVSLSLAIFGETVCAALVAIGLFARPAALTAAITMAVAFFAAHGGKFMGPGNGELAFVYMIGFAAIAIAGAGKLSVDGLLDGSCCSKSTSAKCG